MTSPYAGQSIENWRGITAGLVRQHPLGSDEILDATQVAWNALWATTIGKGAASVPLLDIALPATVVGYFFEVLLGRELARRYPGQWQQGNAGDQKDLHFVEDPRFSIEVKASGQRGVQIYGNRSYGQEVQNLARAKKDKSGYYLTVNFTGSTLKLVRFGWIDGSDWVPQKSPTGQMAGLGAEVYEHKLLPLRGEHPLQIPIEVLAGVGPGLESQCHQQGIFTIQDALDHPKLMAGKLSRVLAAAQAYRDAVTPSKRF
jgi:hypothetical protein